MKKTLIVVVALFVSLAQANIYEVNKDHSKVSFEVEYMSMTKVEGQFKKYDGTFEFNSDKKIISNIKANVEARSVDTNEQKRDFHLKDHEFLFANNYPLLTLESKGSVQLQEKKKMKLNTMLTIKGITKEVAGEITYKGKMIDPWGKENLFFDFEATINRKDFGMNWNKELDQGGYLVGDSVKIMLSIQAQPQGNKTSFSTHMIPSTKAIIEREQLRKGKIKKLSTSTDPKDRK